MKEYIEREAALKNQRWNGRLDEYVVFVRDIESIPAADVVEVVRCENCVPIICPMRNVNKSENAYCSFGRRREEL